jgi:long-subunit acyl-CoA synthetase (AMP-forming)
VDNGLMTPNLKVKRGEVLKRYADRIEALYEGEG